MGTSINTNIAAYFAQANIASASNAAQSSVARLSSGNRIVQASDDVAALATGTSLLTQVTALKTAQSNASQGGSLLQVADGALAQIQSILQQQQSLALQAKSGALTNTGRGFLNQQFQALASEIDILAGGTTFNGVKLIDGSIATGGSTSSNPLQNTALLTALVANNITPTGFTDLSNAPNTTTHLINNQAHAGTTYFTGSFTNSTTGFGDVTTPTVITQPSGSYDKSLYGNIGTAGTFVTHANTGLASYTVTYTASDGTVYQGDIASAGSDGHIAAGATLTLTATTNVSTHATLAFTAGTVGIAATTDNSLDITAALAANTTGAIYTSGAFGSAPTIVAPTGTLADTALHGDLSQGSFTVTLATDATHTTTDTSLAKGYLITYSLNGKTWSGFLAGDNTTIGTAGHLGVTAAQSVTLSTGDNAAFSTIAFAATTQFGAVVASTVDQTANILSALQANFKGATALSGTAVASVTGEAAQAGIGLVSVTADPGKNDTTFVGDLSTGVFAVSGGASAGYSISYAINGSTYQGSLSAYQVTNGGTLVLDNGSGSLAFTISAAAANTLTSSALQTALTNQFAGATAHASHLVATALESNGLGGTIAGSAITAASTAGTLLDGFSGADAKLTSALFDGGATNLPPISNFTATGTGSDVVFSVNIGGTIYSTQGTVTDGTTAGVVGSTFDGATGILNFYKNGDKTTNPSEVLKLDFATAAITASAKITTADEVTTFVDALNSTFGGGGGSGSGGLVFQLGTTSASNVTVNIGSSKTTALYAGSNLDISTTDGASTAATNIATAIDTVTALRAGVGALESQFNFASAALQSSVQNQDAARGQLLDTDITTESTAFATQQVKLQAGISVLAQANQQLQALLKLIG